MRGYPSGPPRDGAAVAAMLFFGAIIGVFILGTALAIGYVLWTWLA